MGSICLSYILLIDWMNGTWQADITPLNAKMFYALKTICEKIYPLRCPFQYLIFYHSFQRMEQEKNNIPPRE